MSTVSSIYDPLGLAAPFLLRGKRVLQQLCKDGINWDDPLPESLRTQWETWKRELPLLEKIEIPRCFRPEEMQTLKTIELHHFSDASCDAYGQCSYLRLVDTNDQVQCSLVLGKAHVAPMKPITIPRLELTAALVSVRVSVMLRRELSYDDVDETFWTDSKVVRAYVRNDARRFHTFVANRVQQIREHSDPKQWKYVESKQNPADDASRGLSPKNISETSRWIRGPAFLWDPSSKWQEQEEEDEEPRLLQDDKEVKKTTAFATGAKEKPATLLKRLEYFSDWFRAKRALALCKRYVQKLKERVCRNKKTQEPTNKGVRHEPVTVDELEEAEKIIIKLVQREAFADETRQLKKRSTKEAEQPESTESRQRVRAAKKKSPVYRLDPFIDEHEILRIGGRIRQASISSAVKHPVLLPK